MLPSACIVVNNSPDDIDLDWHWQRETSLEQVWQGVESDTRPTSGTRPASDTALLILIKFRSTSLIHYS